MFSKFFTSFFILYYAKVDILGNYIGEDDFSYNFGTILSEQYSNNKCKKCGKVMDNGKHTYCPICTTERTEKRGDALKKAGGAVATVGSIAIAVVTRGKFGGGKS